MRCLQHVLWRGAMALGLLTFGSTGALLLPQTTPPACATRTDATSVAAPLASAGGMQVARMDRIDRASC